MVMRSNLRWCSDGLKFTCWNGDIICMAFISDVLIADTAYDSNEFRTRLAEQGSIVVIPSSPSRAHATAHDQHLYKEGPVIECFINKIKHFRRIASRYEKTARNFLAMIHLAGLMVWLR
jgi:transposase